MLLATMSANPLIVQDGQKTVDSYLRAKSEEETYRNKMSHGGTTEELSEWNTRRKAAQLEAGVFDNAMHSRALVYDLFHTELLNMFPDKKENDEQDDDKEED